MSAAGQGADPVKLRRLRQIYALFDETAKGFDLACKEECAACCTCNVTVTGLEARFLVDAMPENEQMAMARRLLKRFPGRRYIPRLTINMLARYCMEGREIAEAENDPAWGRCPLLVEDRCSIYPVRPFGCRVLLSETCCGPGGFARVPELLLTFQNIFMQALESLDRHGIFGNLSDILADLIKDLPPGRGLGLEQLADRESFLTNEKIPVLMVPAGHRKKTEKVVRQLARLIV